MGKDTHLVNIYLKIHNKRPLTMDDLRYLAEYAPECFEKTCRNVVYNRPETKPIMEPKLSNSQENSSLSAWDLNHGHSSATTTASSEGSSLLPNDSQDTSEPTEQQTIEAVLENLMRLESDYFPIQSIHADEVKNLLGNLYMELLFPHNDRDTFISLEMETPPRFDHRA